MPRFSRPKRVRLPNNWEKVKVTYRDNVGILNDTLDAALKCTPFFSFPIGWILWSHLQSFGWGSLFTEAAINGITTLIGMAIAFAFAVYWSFVIPSVVAILAEQFYGTERTIPKELFRLQAWTLGVWICIVFLISWHGELIPPWAALALPMLCAALYGERNKEKLGFTAANLSPKLPATVRVFLLAALATLAMCGTTFALLITMNIGTGFGDVKGWQMWMVMSLCIIIAMIGLIPGFVYLGTRTRHAGPAKSIKALLVASIIVALILFWFLLFLPQAQRMFLRAAGIYSEVRVTYQVVKTDLIPAFKAAGIKVEEQGPMSTVTACLRYNFAGIKLLCSGPLELDGDATNVEQARRNGLPNLRITNGLNCVPATSAELREVRNQIPTLCAATPPVVH